MPEIKGMAIDAESVDKSDKKQFIIQGHKYVKVKDFDNPKIEVDKLVLNIDFADSKDVEYWPNKTSQKMLVAKYGRELNDWIGEVCEFEVLTQLVQGEKKKVLFVK